MAFVFQKPTSTKVTTPSGTDTVHSFHISTESGIQSAHEAAPADALKAVVTNDAPYLHGFLTEFLRFSTPYFAKPYSIPTLLKHLVHELKAPSTTVASYSFLPAELVITAKGFRLLWSAVEQSVLIALPDMEEENAIDELEATELPLTGTENVLELQPASIRHVYDKQRVKEANLRAKLAQYKANRTHMEYLQKYGEDPSDSEDSDSEEEDSE
jgi:hypothetical protein